MAATKISSDAVLKLLKNRRTYYPLSKDMPVSGEHVAAVVREAVLNTPTAFNSQSTRAVVLLGADHDKLWDITREVLRGVVPREQWEPTSKKQAMFKAAAGTVLFFEDTTAVDALQERFPTYADRFPVWATQADAMAQLVTWTALEADGLGANLQHYNPLIDDRVAAAWHLPKTWRLNAQLVFGGRTAPAGDKSLRDINESVKVFGA